MSCAWRTIVLYDLHTEKLRNRLWFCYKTARTKFTSGHKFGCRVTHTGQPEGQSLIWNMEKIEKEEENESLIYQELLPFWQADTFTQKVGAAWTSHAASWFRACYPRTPSLQTGIHRNHTRQERAVTSPSRLYAGFQPSVTAVWRTQLFCVSSICCSRPQINSNRQTKPVLRYHWVTPCGSAEIYTQCWWW